MGQRKVLAVHDVSVQGISPLLQFYRLSYFKSLAVSQQNHPAERKWVEFNARVNYPIKRVLNNMVNDDLIDMDDDLVKFSVSTFTSQVAAVGIKQVFDSWNQHPIPGKFINLSAFFSFYASNQ